MYRVQTLETGFFLADGGAMFGAIPKRAWSRKYPVNEHNLCKLAMRCVLVQGNNRNILIDTGIRTESIKDFSYYGFSDVQQIDLLLAQQGITPEDITDVILTHFHFDHCGASTTQLHSGEWVPRFSNAQYWCSRKQWITANNPCELEQGSFSKEDFVPLYEHGCITLLEEDYKIDSHFSIKLFDGHTPGQLACYIDGEDELFLVPGDVVPTAVNIPLRWVSAYDIHAQASVNAKKELLTDAVRENRTLIFFHDAYTAACKVVCTAENTFLPKIT